MKHGKKKEKEIRSFCFKNRKQTKTARKKDLGSARHMDDKVVVFPTLSYVTEKIMTKEGMPKNAVLDISDRIVHSTCLV